MPLYTINNETLLPVSEQKIELEKHLQQLAERNLQQIFGLSFVATEFEHNGLRIDTLAYDSEARAFIIIEYKRDRSFSVIDQGYAYLALLLNNKAEFILEYNEKTGNTLDRKAVDWSQSRVIFVAQSFTIHQQQAINFKDLPIELWEVKKYDNNTILFNQLKAQEQSESINTISKNPTIQKVSNEVKVHTIEEHFNGKKAHLFSLFEVLRDKLLAWDNNIYINPRAAYIGASLGENGTDTLVYVLPRPNGLRLHMPRFRPEDIVDPLDRISYVPGSVETKNTPESMMVIESEDDVDYALTIIKQARKLFFKKS